MDDDKNTPTIAYDTDPADIEYQTTEQEKITRNKHIEILSTHLGKGCKERSPEEYEEQHQFLNYFIKKDGSITKPFQISGHIHNITNLSKEKYDTVESLFQEKELEIIAESPPENSTDTTGYISLSDKQEKSVTPERMASVAERLLDKVHDVALEDIAAIEAIPLHSQRKTEPGKVWVWVEE